MTQPEWKWAAGVTPGDPMTHADYSHNQHRKSKPTIVDLPWRRAETVDPPEPGARFHRVRVPCECGVVHHYRWSGGPNPLVRRPRCGGARVYIVVDYPLGDETGIRVPSSRASLDARAAVTR